MKKTILLTGATDGIGLETARRLAAEGHTLLLHGRNTEKLEQVQEALAAIAGAGKLECYRADLSSLPEVAALAAAVVERHPELDVLINNAGVFTTPHPRTADGYDVRFVVNAIAPYLLTRELLPAMPADGRVVNLSSAAQAPVDLEAVAGHRKLSDGEAYAQSKLALTMWSMHLGRRLAGTGPAVMAVNPASFLGSKMVKEAYGRAGHDLGIGADVLRRAALCEEFAGASGRYYDNDRQRFADPHPDALDGSKSERLLGAIEAVIASAVG